MTSVLARKSRRDSMTLFCLKISEQTRLSFEDQCDYAR